MMTAKIQWPHQSRADQFYGDPRGVNGMASAKWQAINLTTVAVPFAMKCSWGPFDPVRKITIHKKCADSLAEILKLIWLESGRKQKIIDAWGAGLFGGTFAFRTMRGSARLSMHAYGCAIDLDPARNGLGDYTPALTPSHPVALIFKSAGWVHGADWNGNRKVADERRPDAMHFQAARV